MGWSDAVRDAQCTAWSHTADATDRDIYRGKRPHVRHRCTWSAGGVVLLARRSTITGRRSGESCVRAAVLLGVRNAHGRWQSAALPDAAAVAQGRSRERRHPLPSRGAPRRQRDRCARKLPVRPLGHGRRASSAVVVRQGGSSEVAVTPRRERRNRTDSDRSRRACEPRSGYLMPITRRAST